MRRIYNFDAAVWAMLDAGILTLPMAVALRDVIKGATIYSAAAKHHLTWHGLQKAHRRYQQQLEKML